MMYVYYYFIHCIDEDRSIDIVTMSCVFSGPPRSGKTTVMKRLKGQRVDVEKITKSTDIMDERGPVRIDIMPSCNVVTDQHWVEMEENDEVQAFLNLIIIPNSEVNAEGIEEIKWRDEKLQEPETAKIDVQSDDTNGKKKVLLEDEKPETQGKQDTLQGTQIFESPPTLQNDDVHSMEEHMHGSVVASNPSKESTSVESASADHLPSPQDVLKQAQHHSQQIRAKRQLCKRHFLHFTDTGGQPELRRFTPLLIPGPSVTFIIFRLTHNLEASLASMVCLDAAGKEIEYGSCYCIKDTIQDIILHIFCQEQHSNVRSSIMFIGTHKDQLPKDPATREKCIEDKNKEIMEILEKCPHYDKDMIVKSGDNRLIFSVDNSNFEKEHEYIRSSIRGLCDSNKFKVQVNPQQLLLALTLRGAKQVVMSLKDCISVAKQCGINKHDVSRSLSILEEKMMVVRVFKIEWSILVVVKPKILSKKVSMIIKHFMEIHANNPMSHPVIQYEKLEQIANSEKMGEHIDTAIFIKILHNLLIIARNTSGPGLDTQYVVPSMLPHSLPTTVTGINIAEDMNPSLVDDKTFQSNQLLFAINKFTFRTPSTLHSLILGSLMQNTKWIVNIDQCSKTCTLFSRRENDIASFQLTIFKEGISLSLKTKDWKKSTVIIEHCVNAKNAVSRALRDACVLFGYGAPIVTSYYFLCLRHNCTAKDGVSMINHDCMQSHTTTENVWFSKVSI